MVGIVLGSTIRTLLHGKINPKDWQVLSLGDVGFLLLFRVVSVDYGKPWVLVHFFSKHLHNKSTFKGFCCPHIGCTVIILLLLSSVSMLYSVPASHWRMSAFRPFFLHSPKRFYKWNPWKTLNFCTSLVKITKWPSSGLPGLPPFPPKKRQLDTFGREDEHQSSPISSGGYMVLFRKHPGACVFQDR